MLVFDASVYIERRNQLARALGSGAALFLGNVEAPMNFPHNWYPFRQDSSFLYYWGLGIPNLAALIDVEEDAHILYADPPTVGDIIWSGVQPGPEALAAGIGATEVRPIRDLAKDLQQRVAAGGKVHFEPPYRADAQNRLETLLHLRTGSAPIYASKTLIRAVIAQRSLKEAREIAQIEEALGVTHSMHVVAMQATRPGCLESEIAGQVEGIAISSGGRLAFPCIFSRDGATLHNHSYSNELAVGDLVVHDSGASSPMQYASDITRTLPVSGVFSEQQRAIYECVLHAQLNAIEATGPGVPFRDVHWIAARTIAQGLKALGLMRGDVDEAVAEGAHALFFPHGLGHMIGLDVHDLEGLGEDLVGYDATVQRSDQFGLAYLRLGKALTTGNVVTVEPGCYFIGALIDQWRAAHRHEAFINYEALEPWRNFGGVRIEDDVLITDKGNRVLGRPIPKTVSEVEETCAL